MVSQIHIPSINAELKEILAQRAEGLGIPLSEHIIRVLANDVERPDLSKVPRKSIGRPRKRLATTT